MRQSFLLILSLLFLSAFSDEADTSTNAVETAAVDVKAEVKKDEVKADAEVKDNAKAETEVKVDGKTKGQIDTRIFRLNNCSAIEVAAKFNEMWNGEFGQVWKVTKMAVAFPESNSVMVSAPKPILDACEKAINELDVEAQQVYIEARFVELSNNASHKLGIDWQMLDGLSGTAKIGGGINMTRLGAAVNDYSRKVQDATTTTSFGLSGGTGRDGDINFFNGTLDFSEMSIVLRALESNSDARTFSNPKIIVSSGKKATVDMTEKYPNVKISAKRTNSGSGSDSLDLDMQMSAIPGEDKFMFAKEAFFSWGITLEVTPRISTNGLINVSIVPTISDVEDFVTAGTEADQTSSTGTYSAKYPVINVQRLVTEFNLASETTAVIGGLSRTIEKQVDSGIPLLRDIWWIGPRLFGSKVRVKEQKEIIVFVTVGLVNPKRLHTDAGLPKNAVLGRQYVSGMKLEPGDRPPKNMEGIGSLDMRSLEEQSKDPLAESRSAAGTSFFNRMIPFTRDPSYNKNKEQKNK